MKELLKRMLPKEAKRLVWRTFGKKLKHSTHLRTSTAFEDIGQPGPLITGLFEPLKNVPGWFNVDDCEHFVLALRLQSNMGMRGDMLEIGSYHGRSTAVMATCLGPGEKIVVCDPFEGETDDNYDNKPSPQNLLNNIRRVNPDLAADRIEIHRCLSNDLALEPQRRFRFIHVDGGHSAEQAYFDLVLCNKHLAPGGLMVMDDYCSPDWPEVTTGTDRFLGEHPDVQVLADLNRHGATGRKVYMIKAL